MNTASNITVSLNDKCCGVSAIFIFLLFSFSLILSNGSVNGQSFTKSFGTGRSGTDKGVKNAARGNGMSFTPNKGQLADMDGKLRPDVLYYGGGGGADIYLRRTGMSYVYTNMGEVINEADEYVENLMELGTISESDEKERKEDFLRTKDVKIHRVDMDFLNCMTSISCVNEDELEGCENYYYAHCPLGVTNVKQFNRVIYKNIYKNIDVVYYGDRQNGVKYDLVVQPHADPHQIQLNWKGAEHIYIDRQGGLVIKTSVNEFYESIPRVYQNIKGQIVDVDAGYNLNGTIVTFELGTWNPEYPLIIDPWATYYAGTSGAIQSCSGSDIATDAVGNVASTGWTASGSLPVSAGSFQASYRGGFADAFVVKFSITGARIFGTYFGGSGRDFGYGLAIDANNDILVTGKTQSGNFPTKDPGAGAYFQAGNAGDHDVFISKFTPAGLLTWSTLYGGSLYDEGIDVITDAASNILMVGSTQSANFPTQTPFQAAIGAGATQNAFMVKLNSNCVRQWATYYGGSGRDGAMGATRDAAGAFFVTGFTASTNFPVLAGHQMISGGGIGEAFIVKLNTLSGFPVWATYYGGSDWEKGTVVVTDTFGNVIVAGDTRSTTNISSIAANQTACGSCGGNNGDAFLVKFNGSTGVRVWATYIGGTNDERTGGCAIDANNNIYWYGEIEDSAPGTFIIDQCAYQQYRDLPFAPGQEDFYISKFDPNGNRMCTTAFGGLDEEDGDQNPHTDIAIYGPYIYATGWVAGLFPVTAGAFQTTAVSRPAGGNAFVAQICRNICEPKFSGIDNVSANQTNVCPNIPVAFTSAVNKTTCTDTTLKYKWTFTGGTPATSTIQNPSVSYNSPGTYSVKLIISNLCNIDSLVKTNYIVVHPCAISAAVTGATICPGSCATITATGLSGIPPFTYSWNTGATTSTINVCPTTTTAYPVTVTDALVASATISALVTVKPPVVIATSTSDIKCNNIVTTGSAYVDVNSGIGPSYTYNWSNGSTGQLASGLTAGTHTITVTDGGGCSIFKTVVINDPTPVVTFTSPVTVCVGTNVNFVNTGATGTYSWTIAAPVNVTGTTANFSYTFLTTGTYSITHTVQNTNSGSSCTGTSTSKVTVINCTGPTVTTTGSSACPGTCAAVTSSGLGGINPYTFTWSSGATSQNMNACPLTTTTYTVTIKDSGGNTSTSTAVVSVNPPVAVIVTANNISCSGNTNGSMFASGSSGTPAYTYIWSNGISGSSVSGLSAGIYTVTVTDSKGCTSTSSTSIISPLPLSGQFAKGTNGCAGCGCKEWLMVTAVGGTTPYNYTWPDGYIYRYKNQLCPGTYTINIKDKNGCIVNVSLNTP